MSATWWDGILEMRRNVSPEPGIDTWDSGLQLLTCDNAHGIANAIIIPGITSVDGLAPYCRNAAEPCKRCGTPLRVEKVIAGTWLPQAEREVLILVEAQQVAGIVACSADGATVQPIERGEPLLHEMEMAGAVRHAQGFMSVSEDNAEALKAVVARFPDYPPAARALAQVLEELEPADDEDDEFDEDEGVQFISPDPATLYEHALARAGMVDGGGDALFFVATDVLTFLSMIKPSDVRGNDEMAQAVFALAIDFGGRLAAARQPLDAARFFQIACMHDPSRPEPLYNLAICYGNADLWLEACAALQRLMALAPDFHDARSRLDQARERVKTSTGALLGMQCRETLAYDDSLGRERILLNFQVKIAAKDRLIESEVTPLSLRREKDLFKVLVAKGHNARVARGVAGRPFVFVVEVAPEDDFLRFANATSWRTPDGRVVPSAAALVFLGSSTDPIGSPHNEVITLPRIPELESEEGDLVYPDAYAGYDD